MNPHAIAPAAEQYIERMGLLWEGEGLPRIAGRILGYLLLTPDPRTTDDMALALGVSRASVNTDARRLERLGFVERNSRPGDRRDYYVIAPNLVERMISGRLDRLRSLQSALDDAHHLPDTPPVVRDRVCAFRILHLRVIDALEGVLREFHSCRRGSGPATPVNHT
ncbi:MAG: GbsR/MarR family transcriptional regulator [Gemmatimonadaceae bacterium]